MLYIYQKPAGIQVASMVDKEALKVTLQRLFIIDDNS